MMVELRCVVGFPYTIKLLRTLKRHSASHKAVSEVPIR
jgi:hypothetical protein